MGEAVEDDDDGLAPGDRIGRYTLRGILGVGGMGRVYRAWDPELSRDIALKVLRRATVGERDVARRRMLREGQALARLSHPNVVPVHAVDNVDGAVFIAMELIEGQSLHAWLQAESRGWPEIVEVMRQAGEGLAAAHAQDMVHRDFKPTNVAVGDDGRVRVMDFGLARGGATESMSVPSGGASDFLQGQPITKAGEVLGTPAYMAPEQHFGRAADPKSDQFAYCVTFYEALFGRRPFSERRGFRGLARAKDRGEILKPPRGSGVPRWLQAVVLRGLSARRVDRWESMTALLQALHPPRSRSVWIVPASAVVLSGLAAGVWMWAAGRL